MARISAHFRLLRGRPTPAVLLGAIVAALALRLLGLEGGIWLDEAFSLDAALGRDLAGLRDSDKPPLYFLLLRAWSTLGISDAWLRLLSVAIAMLTLAVLVRWLGRTSRLAATLGAALFAAWPLLLRYGREIRGYGLLLLWTALAFDASDRLASAPERRRTAWALGLVLALAVATHLIGAFLVAAVLVHALLGVERGRRRAALARWIVPVALPPAVAFGFFYFLFLTQVDKAGAWWMGALDASRLLRTAEQVLGSAALAGALELAGMPPGAARGVAWTLVVAPVALVAVTRGPGGRRALAGAVLYWAQLAAFSLLREPIFVARTALPGLVPWIAFLALQTAETRGRRRAAAIALLGATGLLFAGGWLARDAWAPYERWKEAARAIAPAAEAGAAVRVHPPYAASALGRYLPATSGIGAAKDVDVRDLAGVDDLILVVRLDANTRSEIDALDRLARSLAGAVGPRVADERFGNLVVTRFRRPPPAPGPRRGAAPP